MLFDLRGRRRRVVQVTYLMLALLLGGGLVLFGVGGDVSGGLVDAFKGGGGASGDSALNDQIEKQEERLQKNPRNEVVLQALVRNYYAKATQSRESGTAFPPDAKDDLRKAGAYWNRYVAAADKPNPATAGFALQIYDAGALNKPKEAVKAASILAETGNDAASYLRLVSYAARAGDTRTADLAGQKAVDLAPKAQKKLVKKQVEALKKSGQQQPPSG
jgi:translation initiation factor 2B subunit (eIF-2B alpha/beta/delta family)